jgi:hypothetical protein
VDATWVAVGAAARCTEPAAAAALPIPAEAQAAEAAWG